MFEGKNQNQFANQFDAEGKMRILDGMRYYKKTKKQNNMPRIVVTLEEPVSEECLQYATELALRRCRIFSFVVIQDDKYFYLKQNTAKPVVHLDDGKQHTVCTEDNNGYMTWIGYHDCTISVEMFHGVSDGVGLMYFMQTLLYYYCEKRYGNVSPDDIPGIKLIDTPEDPREYADSLLFITQDEVPATEQYQWESAFQLPETHMDEEDECQRYELRVDAKDYEEYVSKMNTSRASVFAAFMNQVIAKCHGITENPIVGAMAVNARKAYNAEQTMQCCVATIPVWFDKKVQSMSMEERLKYAKQMIRGGMQTDNILAKAIGTKKFNQMLDTKYPTLREKQEFCRQITKAGSNKYTYGISFVGDISFGKGIDEHIAKVVTMLCANTSPIIIEIVKHKDTYYMTYCTYLAKDPYVHELQALFEAEGIKCVCEHKENYVETVAEFGM